MDNASESLPNLARGLLSQLLEEALRLEGSVPAAKFRAENYASIDQLDKLEVQGHLRRREDRYEIASSSLPLLETEPALGLLSDIERVYCVLRDHYLKVQGAPVPLRELAAIVGMPLPRVSTSLAFMLDNSFWSGGHTTDLLCPDAYVILSEGILKYSTFRAAAKQIRSWRLSTAGMAASSTSTGGYEKLSPTGGEWTHQHALRSHAPLPSGEEEQVSTDPLALKKNLDGSMTSAVKAWPAIRACLQAFSFYDIKEIVGLAGLDVTALAYLVQKAVKGATKGELITAIDAEFAKLERIERHRFLAVAAEEILRRKPESEEQLAEYLTRLGWARVGASLVPLRLLDPADLSEIPEESRGDLRKAAQRFRDGDLTGAISAACAAVDSATSHVYQQKALGDPTQASFQERCKRAMLAKGVLADLDGQLKDLGWQQAELLLFRKNLDGALNQGAYVMQTLRSRMGDVHGSKPILRSLVFDSLKWTELIVGSLVERRDS